MTLIELIHHANHRLAELGLDRVADGRVAESMTLRNVRFLRQAGVVSRPDGQGPAARWSELHLRQLVATRALQSTGLSISEVRDRINGLDAVGLKELESEAVNSSRSDSPALCTGTCSAWRITPEFLLVSTSRVRLAPEKLALIKRILEPPRP